MGILSDVLIPITELIEPSEGLGQSLMADKLCPILHQVRESLVELQLRVLATHFQHYR